MMRWCFRWCMTMMWRSICGVAFLPLVLHAQTVDIENDPVTADYVFLQTLRGYGRMSAYSIAPMRLASVEMMMRRHTQTDVHTELSTSLAQYSAEYNAPLLRSRAYPVSVRGKRPDTLALLPVNELHWFKNEAGRFRGLTYQDSLIHLMADIQMMSRLTLFDQTTPNDAPRFPLSPNPLSGTVGVGRIGARVMGSYDNTIDFFLELTNGRTLSGKDSIALLTDPLLVGSTKFFEDNFFDRYRGYIQVKWEYFRIRYGRDRMSIGFSPIDNLALSARTAPMDGVVAEAEYGGFRFTALHNAIEGLDTANNAVLNKFLALHRISFEPSEELTFAITDMMIYSGRGIDFTYLNPISFYVSAGLGTLQKNRQDNSALQFDFAVRPKKLLPNTMIYGAWFLDDININSLGKKTGQSNINKFAYQLGVAWTSDVLPMALTTEYVRIDPFVYSHRSMVNSYTHFNRSIGYQMQPNSDRFALQARWWFAPRTTMLVEADYTRMGENILDTGGMIVRDLFLQPFGNAGSDVLRGDGDNLVYRPFLSGVRADMRRIRMVFSTEVFTNIFCDVNMQYESRTGGNAPRTTLNAWLEVRVGY